MSLKPYNTVSAAYASIYVGVYCIGLEVDVRHTSSNVPPPKYEIVLHVLDEEANGAKSTDTIDKIPEGEMNSGVKLQERKRAD